MDNINSNKKEGQYIHARKVLPVTWYEVDKSTPKTPFHSLKQMAAKTSI